jgi:ribosomal protein L37E
MRIRASVDTQKRGSKMSKAEVKWISCRKCGADLIKDADKVCFACGTPVEGRRKDNDYDDKEDD